MATVRNRFMTATAAMSVFPVVCSAGMAGGTGRWIRAALPQRMFIHVSSVGIVKMAVVQIIDMSFVLDRGVSATCTMRMRVLIVCFVIAHFPMLSLGSNNLRACVATIALTFHLRPREREN
jgi:hypothetical protein